MEDDGLGEGGKEGEEGEGGELCDAEVEALMVLYPNTIKHELLSMTGPLGRLLLYSPAHTSNMCTYTHIHTHIYMNAINDWHSW